MCTSVDSLQPEEPFPSECQWTHSRFFGLGPGYFPNFSIIEEKNSISDNQLSFFYSSPPCQSTVGESGEVLGQKRAGKPNRERVIEKVLATEVNTETETINYGFKEGHERGTESRSAQKAWCMKGEVPGKISKGHNIITPWLQKRKL